MHACVHMGSWTDKYVTTRIVINTTLTHQRPAIIDIMTQSDGTNDTSSLRDN